MKTLTSIRQISLVVLLATCVTCTPTGAADPVPAVTDKDVLDHLEQVIAWQRDIVSLDTDPTNSLQVLLKDNLRKNALDILRFSFDFAKAQTVVLSRNQIIAGDSVTNSRQQEILASAASADINVTRLQQEIKLVGTQLARAKAKARPALKIKREQLENELKLATAQQDVLKNVVQLFATTDNTAPSELGGKIENLLQALPELQDDSKKPAPKTNAAVTKTVDATTDAPVVETKRSGLFGLVSDMLDVYRQKKEIDALKAETIAIHDATQDFITRMRNTMQDLSRQGNTLAQSVGTTGPENIAAQRADVDGVIDNYKQLSTAIIPLGQTSMLFTAAEHNFDEWSASEDKDFARLLQSFLIRLTILCVAILIPVLVSEAARRATHRYIHDSRWQKQLRFIRRIIFGIVIFIIILLNVVTEIGSLATYAGLLTAGLAVALQNVILSVVAHFFFFGRFSVRIGDRVTIAGVTGEVVQLGITRLYLLELGGPDFELHPTGQIVTFPNSILFQPSSFSKQIPGANYSWQELTFLIDPGVDYKLATERLNNAVSEVYAEYHEIIEYQQLALAQATSSDVKIPEPKGFIQFVGNGLAFVIRYPVVSSHMVEVSQRITQKILETLDNEPSMRFVNNTPPRIAAALPTEQVSA